MGVRAWAAGALMWKGDGVDAEASPRGGTNGRREEMQSTMVENSEKRGGELRSGTGMGVGPRQPRRRLGGGRPRKLWGSLCWLRGSALPQFWEAGRGLVGFRLRARALGRSHKGVLGGGRGGLAQHGVPAEQVALVPADGDARPEQRADDPAKQRTGHEDPEVGPLAGDQGGAKGARGIDRAAVDGDHDCVGEEDGKPNGQGRHGLHVVRLCARREQNSEAEERGAHNLAAKRPAHAVGLADDVRACKSRGGRAAGAILGAGAWNAGAWNAAAWASSKRAAAERLLCSPRALAGERGVMPYRIQAATMEPANWATTLAAPWTTLQFPESTRENVTAGLKCPPEMWPRQ